MTVKLRYQGNLPFKILKRYLKKTTKFYGISHFGLKKLKLDIF